MFFAKKILGSKDILYLGNLNAKRDWGHAKDYVEMQWKILQQRRPDDYVIATGKTLSVRDFVNECCKYLNLKIKWIGKDNKDIIAVKLEKIRKNEDSKLLNEVSIYKDLNGKGIPKIKWIGKDMNERAYLIKGKKKELIIKIDKKYYRPLEINYLKGDPRKAFKQFKYKLKYSLKDLVKEMIDSDILEVQKKL